MRHKLFSILTIASVLFAQNMMAQDAQAVVPATPASTYYALRYTLLATAILLMIIIIALAYVLNNLASVYLQSWKRDAKSAAKSLVGIGILFSMMSQTAKAQEAAAAAPSPTFGIDLANMPIDIYVLMFTVLVEMIMVYGLVNLSFVCYVKPKQSSLLVMRLWFQKKHFSKPLTKRWLLKMSIPLICNTTMMVFVSWITKYLAGG